MIAAIVPVHNEEALLPSCLSALIRAADHQRLSGEWVRIFIVLDDCSDRSSAIAASFGVDVIVCKARNVGRARGLGAEAALAAGARWLAFTDADSRVPVGWLTKQLRLGTDVVCGLVEVDDWNQREAMQPVFEAGYFREDGHRHIHGANLGVSASSYRMVGGFAPLALNEDVTLVRELEQRGAKIAWVVEPQVRTSGRLQGRAMGGFASFLACLDRRIAPMEPMIAGET